MVLFALFLLCSHINALHLDSSKSPGKGKTLFFGIERTIRAVEGLGKHVVLGKVGSFDEETREKLALAAMLSKAEIFFFEPLKGEIGSLDNKIFVEKSETGLTFTEDRPLGIVSKAPLDILPYAQQPVPDPQKQSSVYSLKNNRFAYAYHTKEKSDDMRIDIYEKLPFIEKMCCTEFTILPKDYSLSYITPDEIAVIETVSTRQVLFKHLNEPTAHTLLAPFSAVVSKLCPPQKQILIRAISFAPKNNLIAVLLKIETFCTILIGHQTKSGLPVLQINPHKECHVCRWDAEETGIITNACYYKYAFALGLLNLLKQPPSFPEAQQVLLNNAPHGIAAESASFKKSEIIINTGT